MLQIRPYRNADPDADSRKRLLCLYDSSSFHKIFIWSLQLVLPVGAGHDPVGPDPALELVTQLLLC